MDIRAVRLEGTSMLPVFRAGDLALLDARFSGRDLVRGDCAAYETGGRTLLHRVTGTDADGVWFSDDAALLERHHAPWRAIRGKVLGGGPFSRGLPGFLYFTARTAALRALRALLPSGRAS